MDKYPIVIDKGIYYFTKPGPPWVQVQFYHHGHDFIVANSPARKWYMWFLYADNYYPNGRSAPEGGWVCCPDDYFAAFDYGKALLEELCIEYCMEVSTKRNGN